MPNNSDFKPDCPNKIEIPEMCKKHAQTMRDIGKVNVRVDSIEDRLSKLEKSPDEKLDLIISLLQKRG